MPPPESPSRLGMATGQVGLSVRIMIGAHPEVADQRRDEPTSVRAGGLCVCNVGCQRQKEAREMVLRRSCCCMGYMGCPLPPSFIRRHACITLEGLGGHGDK